MSQTKPQDSVVCSNPADLRLLIESNERGKRAQAYNRVYRQRIKILEENAGLYQTLIISKDSTMSDMRLQLSAMNLLSGNQQLIIQAKDGQITALNAAIKTGQKQLRRQKARTVFAYITGAIVTGATIYFLR